MAFNAAGAGREAGGDRSRLGRRRRASPTSRRWPGAAVRAVADLLAAVGIPRTLADLGVPADRLADMARDAMSARRLVENNPRPLDEESALALLRAAHAGDLTVLGEALSPHAFRPPRRPASPRRLVTHRDTYSPSVGNVGGATGDVPPARSGSGNP